MISCTEFIPSYSELFTYLEEHHGKQAVRDYWDHCFVPDGSNSPLADLVLKEGIRGCFSYWTHTLNEEAADFTMYLNEKAGWFMNVMHHCPSKGRLLALEKTIGIKPYCDYCLHCDGYRHAVKLLGLDYVFNTRGIDHASCSIFISDPKRFDGRILIDENTEIMDRRATDNEYLHRDFHASLDRGISYLADTFGTDEMLDYLRTFTRHVYGTQFEALKNGGFAALKAFLEKPYLAEHAEDAISVTFGDDTLTARITCCPAVRHIRSLGKDVSRYYVETTRTVLGTLADETGYRFTLDRYDEQTGAAEYRFARR